MLSVNRDLTTMWVPTLAIGPTLPAMNGYDSDQLREEISALLRDLRAGPYMLEMGNTIAMFLSGRNNSLTHKSLVKLANNALSRATDLGIDLPELIKRHTILTHASRARLIAGVADDRDAEAQEMADSQLTHQIVQELDRKQRERFAAVESRLEEMERLLSGIATTLLKQRSGIEPRMPRHPPSKGTTHR